MFRLNEAIIRPKHVACSVLYYYCIIYCVRLIYKIHLKIDNPTGMCHLRRKGTIVVTTFSKYNCLLRVILF